MKEYADNSGLNMIAAADYAESLYYRAVSFQQFAEQWPNLAASEWGQDVHAEMIALNKGAEK